MRVVGDKELGGVEWRVHSTGVLVRVHFDMLVKLVSNTSCSSSGEMTSDSNKASPSAAMALSFKYNQTV